LIAEQRFQKLLLGYILLFSIDYAFIGRVENGRDGNNMGVKK